MTKCCTSNSLNLRHELIDLYYDYITNFQEKVRSSNEVLQLKNHVKNLQEQLNKKNKQKLNAGLEIYVKTVSPAIPEIYVKYIQDYGVPKKGIWDANKLSCLIEKYNLEMPQKQVENKEKISTIEDTIELVEEPTLEDVTELVAEYEKIVEEIYGVNIESCYDDDGGNE